MANLPSSVQPGDVITSDFMNVLLAKYTELEKRIEKLEQTSSGGKPEITSPTPSDTFRIGDELRIVGRNFGSPTENTVFIDTTVQVTKFKSGSDDKLLILDIPFVQNVPESGRSVPLTITNPRGFASTSFILAQPQVTVPTGTLTVSLSGSPPPSTTLQAGQSYIFTYTITASTTLNEIYTLTPSIDAGWQVRAVDSNNNPIVPQELFIQKPAAPTVPTVVTVRVQVTIPDGTPDDTVGNLRLKVTSRRNPSGLVKTSDPRALTVGSQPPAAEDIVISLDSVISASIEGGAIVVSPSTTAYATFKVIVPEAGNYSIQPLTFKDDPNKRWSATPVGSSSGIFMQPPQATFSAGITANANAPNAKMVIKVVSDTDATVFGDIDQDVKLGT